MISIGLVIDIFWKRTRETYVYNIEDKCLASCTYSKRHWTSIDWNHCVVFCDEMLHHHTTSPQLTECKRDPSEYHGSHRNHASLFKILWFFPGLINTLCPQVTAVLSTRSWRLFPLTFFKTSISVFPYSLLFPDHFPTCGNPRFLRQPGWQNTHGGGEGHHE